MGSILLFLMVLAIIFVPPFLVLWLLRKIPLARYILKVGLDDFYYRWHMKNFQLAAQKYPVPEMIADVNIEQAHIQICFLKDHPGQLTENYCCYLALRDGVVVWDYRLSIKSKRKYAVSIFLPYEVLSPPVCHKSPWWRYWVKYDLKVQVKDSPLALLLYGKYFHLANQL